MVLPYSSSVPIRPSGSWATALAEAHRFDESITIAERALRMARDAEDDRLHSELQRRLQRFRNHEPYHFRPDGPNNKTP